MDIDNDYYKNEFNKLYDMNKEGNKYRTEWMRGFLLIQSAIFGFQVAFYGNSTHKAGYLYMMAMTLLSMSLLFGIAASYLQVSLHNRLHSYGKEKILQAIARKARVEPCGENPGKIFLISEKISFVSFSLSVVLFVIDIIL